MSDDITPGRSINAPRIRRGMMRRSLRLLEMEYAPSELAEELGCTSKTIYQSYLPAGLPFRKDGTGHVWIVGTAARAWLEKMTQHNAENPVAPIGSDEAFCVRCGDRVKLVNPTRRHFGRAGIMAGTCPICGKDIRRFIKLSEVTA